MTGDRVRVTFDGVAVLVDEHGVHEVAVFDDLSGVIQLQASQVTVTKLPAAVVERLLFVGGPKHGQMLNPYDGSRYVVAFDTTRTDEPWPDDWLHTQVTYTRSTMVLDVDDRRYARSMFIDTRLWSGVGPIPPEVRVEVNDAIVRAWMAGGRDVTNPG